MKKKHSKEELLRRSVQAKEKRFNEPLSTADAVIIKILPKEGEGISPFKPTALSVALIVQRLSDMGASHDQVTGSIRSMLHRKLVVKVELSPRTDGPGYQRTKRGVDFLRDYEKHHDPDER